MAEAPIIAVSGLRTQFGSQVIHDNLDFSVRRGEVMGVVGGSGTGKSVLMRTIIGLIKPAAGRTEVLGRDMATLDPRATQEMQSRWGVLFQDGALFSSLTVAENIEVPLKEHSGLSPRLRREIGDVKIRAGVAIYAPDREAEILDRVAARSPGPLDAEAARRLFERIIDESRSLERVDKATRGGRTPDGRT